MIKTLSLTLLFATLSSSVFAQENSYIPTVNVVDALQKVTAINSAQYDSIELVPGKDEKLVYFAEGIKGETRVITVIDANTGNDLTKAYTQPKHTLADVLKFVNITYDGIVDSAFMNIDPETGTVYFVSLYPHTEQADIVTLVVSGDTLKVIDTIIEDEQMEEEFEFAYTDSLSL